MLTTRELPPAEWHRLAGANLADLWARLPATTRVIVVEDRGEIVGCVTGLLMLHAEGLWIAPSHRKRATVWRSLVARFWRVAGEFGCEGAWAAAVSDEMRDILTRLQARPLPGDHYLLPKESTICHLS